MKKRASLRALLTIIMITMVMAVHALPEPFEGIVTFKVTYPESKFTENQLAFLPKTLTITLKGDRAKSEILLPMGLQIEIFNYADNTKVALVNISNHKYALHETADEIMEDKKNDPKGQVQMTNETKTIAGYTCKKAIVTTHINGIKMTFDVWFTEEFGLINTNFDNPLYKDIKGVLLEFSLISSQFTMKFTAITVEKKSISSHEFNIPSDYPLISKEHMKTIMVGKQ
jgi:hypothetical protein